MLTQTWAIFVDAYRELNSKKLFWITMVLSGLVVAIYAAIGIDKTSPTFLWFRLRFLPINSDQFPPALMYKLIFLQLGIGLWLTWIATILALISTAPIFPDMIASGAIETVLSKPISRWRLFLTKYVAGLLFVTMQVAVFTGACFLVIGIRGGAWEPGLFLAVPIVVVFFSYLFSVCAVLGLLTRSTIASLLMTILFWFVLYVLNMGDAILVGIKSQTQAQIDQRTASIERAERGTARAITQRLRDEGQDLPADFQPTPEQMNEANPFIATLRSQSDDDRELLEELAWWSRLVVWVKTPLPKTSETTSLLSRTLIDFAQLDAATAAADDDAEASPEQAEEPIAPPDAGGARRRGPSPQDERIQRQSGLLAREEFQNRSVWWVMGTSLVFESVVLLFGAWRFSRRDF